MVCGLSLSHSKIGFPVFNRSAVISHSCHNVLWVSPRVGNGREHQHWHCAFLVYWMCRTSSCRANPHPCQLLRGMRSVHQRAKCFMVHEDCTVVAIQVGPVLLDSPNNTQCLHLCHTIVALMCLQGSACKGNWIHRPIVLLLGQDSKHPALPLKQ